MRFVIGHSDELEAHEAAAAAVEGAMARLEGEPVAGIVLLFSESYDAHVVQGAVRAAWPNTPMIGATTDGELSSREGFHHDSVLIVLITGASLQVATGIGHQAATSPDAAAAAAIRDAGLADAEVCLTFAAPIDVDLVRVVAGLERCVPPSCVVFGGAAGAHNTKGNIRQLCDSELTQDAVVVMLLRGGVRVTHGIGSGWTPVGPEHVVTASAGHVIERIDGVAAIEIYNRFWGDLPQLRFTEHPLAIYEQPGDESFTLRAVFGANAETGALQCAATIVEGSRVRMTEVLQTTILHGAHVAATEANGAWSGAQPAGVFVVSCAARKWLLGTRVAEELDTVQRALQAWPSVPVFGFMSFGELLRPAGAPGRFHNQTCLLLALGDG